jgi:hypothetical protein
MMNLALSDVDSFSPPPIFEVDHTEPYQLYTISPGLKISVRETSHKMLDDFEFGSDIQICIVMSDDFEFSLAWK